MPFIRVPSSQEGDVSVVAVGRRETLACSQGLSRGIKLWFDLFDLGSDMIKGGEASRT